MSRTDLKHLCRSINSLCVYLKETYLINCGGCCYVAYLIAKHLDKLNIKYDLVIDNCSSKNKFHITEEIISHNINLLKENSVIGEYTCNHYSLRLKSIGIINKGYKNNYRYFIPNINHNHIKWIYDNGSWNDCYDVRNNNVIEKIINSFFAPLYKMKLQIVPKVSICPRCKIKTKQFVFDYNYNLYKCSKCNNIHV